MTDKVIENNQVTVMGEIISDFAYSHEIFGEGFYMVDVKVQRLSESFDVIPLMVSERLIDVNADYKGKNISEVLGMTVDEALEFFAPLPKLRNRLQTLQDVGLGYVKLGQPSTELSGGEAQRVKLATELSKQSTGSTVYILDEPTTGLHTADVHQLVEVLQRFVDKGNTVVVIEHNLDVIKTADYIIDLGPEGGSGGGTVVCTGTPEEVAEHPGSYTGKYLKNVLETS